MCFFNLVDQHNRVWFSADFLCELSSFFIPDIPGRCSDKSADGELLHILTHIGTDKGIFAVKDVAGKRFCQLSFTDSSRTKKYERTDRPRRVFEPRSCPLYSLGDLVDSLILPDNFLFQLTCHIEQLFRLGLCNLDNRYTRHHGNNRGDIGFRYVINCVGGTLLPLQFCLLKRLEKRLLLVTKLCSLLEVLHPHNTVFLSLDLLYSLLQVKNILGNMDIA